MYQVSFKSSEGKKEKKKLEDKEAILGIVPPQLFVKLT